VGPRRNGIWHDRSEQKVGRGIRRIPETESKLPARQSVHELRSPSAAGAALLTVGAGAGMRDPSGYHLGKEAPGLLPQIIIHITSGLQAHGFLGNLLSLLERD
jgi:hypothetical protein